MTTEDGAVPYLDDHCAGHNPDQYHQFCAVEYRTPLGVLKRCTCAAHANDAQEESAD